MTIHAILSCARLMDTRATASRRPRQTCSGRLSSLAHVRKVNPRDSATDLGKFEDTLTRLILRRGIPFGQPIIGVEQPSPDLLAQERGLMFLSYGATIENQFEFLM